jgi:peptidoglycan/LPS O-acetylase OafA/YrhL
MDTGKYLEVFAVGMLLALCYTLITRTTQGETYRRLLQRLSPWLWLLGLTLLACAAARNCVNATWCVGAVPTTTFAAYPLWALEFAFALGFGLCVLAILFNSGWLKRFFSWTPLRWVGLISFSLYLWQFVFINFVDAGFSPFLKAHFSKPVILCIFPIAQWAVILSGSFVLYVMVERPNMHLSDRLRKKMLTRETQKVSVPPLEIKALDESFADEETEPRRPVVSASGGRLAQDTKLVP